MISLLLADDHDLILEGIATMVSGQEFQVVARAHGGHRAAELYRQFLPDLCLLDLRMPEGDGLEATRRILEFDPAAKIIMLTTFDTEEDIQRCLEAGAQGYLLKDVRRPELLHTLREVQAGRNYLAPGAAARLRERLNQIPLSNREQQVLEQVALGLSNKEIAIQLKITEGTVKLHLNNLFHKMNVTSRTEAVRQGLKRGLWRAT